MLNVSQLSMSFGQRKILNQVSFALKPGELLRVTGPNGTGKSTLLNIIAGLQDGFQGEVIWTKESTLLPKDSSTQASHLLAWIPPDSNALDADMSAMDHLMFWLDLYGAPGPREDRKSFIVKHLHKWGLRSSYVAQKLPVSMFSTGMRRRLALARLELCNASVWLLDEPLFGLDDQAISLFTGVLQNHLQRNRSAILITHDDRILQRISRENLVISNLDLSERVL